MASDKDNLKSTQSYLRVSEIKSDTMVMDDGTYVAIVAVSSTNFSLKSQEEQNALIAAYQTFLNSLDFTIQILMQSRKIDIHGYLEKLNRIMEQQTNELLRVQTGEYIEFISKLVENASIMNKNFYIIVPYQPALINAASGGGLFAGLFGKKNASAQAQQVTIKAKEFQENKLHLEQRVNTVVNGLSAMGLKALPMQTGEIIELIYNSYNFENGPMIDASKLSEIKIQN